MLGGLQLSFWRIPWTALQRHARSELRNILSLGAAVIFGYRKSLLFLVLLIPLAVVLARTAWITEDAFIMFRTIDNFYNGLGLTWNPTERVQVYTCPLWMFLLTAAYFVSEEPYYTSMVLNMFITLATGYVIFFHLAHSLYGATLAMVALLLSRGFIDYSTSGLENPLTHLLLACFLAAFLNQEASLRRHFVLCLIACLAVLNRMDTGLLYLPVLMLSFAHNRTWPAIRLTGLAFMPLVLWELFSLIYYGMLVPNTAYVKLNTGTDELILWAQGIEYYINGFTKDPMTMLVIFAGLVAAFISRDLDRIVVACGVVLYLLYIVKIGGDYMSMRFFTAPFLVAVVLLARTPTLTAPRPALLGVALLFAIALATPRPTLASGPDYGTGDIHIEVDRYGIADERGFYYPIKGMLRENRIGLSPDPYHVERLRGSFRPDKPPILGTIGLSVYAMHPLVHVIDTSALSDAFLARLPAMCDPTCRPGHFMRRLPAGYVETVASGENHLADPGLATLYDRIQTIVSGDLLSWDRMHAIWELNTGQLDRLVAFEHYKTTSEPP